MGTPRNYFPEDISPTDLQNRIRDVIEISERLRQEINRIRNTSIGLGMPVPREILAGLSHLQVDLVHLKYEYGLMIGLSGDEMLNLVLHLENPMSVLSNEDPPKR